MGRKSSLTEKQWSTHSRESAYVRSCLRKLQTNIGASCITTFQIREASVYAASRGMQKNVGETWAKN